MEKPTIVRFDRRARIEYQELQKAVLEGQKAKKKPTYEQLLNMDHNEYNKLFGYKKR